MCSLRKRATVAASNELPGGRKRRGAREAGRRHLLVGAHDLALLVVLAERGEHLVVDGVVTDLEAVADRLAGRVAEVLELLGDDEERRRDLVVLEDLHELRRVRGGPVVEGERDELLVGRAARDVGRIGEDAVDRPDAAAVGGRGAVGRRGERLELVLGPLAVVRAAECARHEKHEEDQNEQAAARGGQPAALDLAAALGARRGRARGSGRRSVAPWFLNRG